MELKLICVKKDIVCEKDTKSHKKGDVIKSTKYYVELENGNRLQFLPYSYEDENGVKRSNAVAFNAVCVIEDNLPF